MAAGNPQAAGQAAEQRSDKEGLQFGKINIDSQTGSGDIIIPYNTEGPAQPGTGEVRRKNTANDSDSQEQEIPFLIIIYFQTPDPGRWNADNSVNSSGNIQMFDNKLGNEEKGKGSNRPDKSL